MRLSLKISLTECVAYLVWPFVAFILSFSAGAVSVAWAFVAVTVIMGGWLGVLVRNAREDVKKDVLTKYEHQSTALLCMLCTIIWSNYLVPDRALWGAVVGVLSASIPVVFVLQRKDLKNQDGQPETWGVAHITTVSLTVVLHVTLMLILLSQSAPFVYRRPSCQLVDDNRTDIVIFASVVDQDGSLADGTEYTIYNVEPPGGISVNVSANGELRGEFNASHLGRQPPYFHIVVHYSAAGGLLRGTMDPLELNSRCYTQGELDETTTDGTPGEVDGSQRTDEPRTALFLLIPLPMILVSYWLAFRYDDDEEESESSAALALQDKSVVTAP